MHIHRETMYERRYNAEEICRSVRFIIRMADRNEIDDQEVLRFILDRIETVPHLEALLLLWDSRPKGWSPAELAQRLYVDENTGQRLLQNLATQNLIVLFDAASSEVYAYRSKSPDEDRLMAAVAAKYRSEIVAISTMIHRRASLAVRDFAGAFRFIKNPKKE